MGSRDPVRVGSLLVSFAILVAACGSIGADGGRASTPPTLPVGDGNRFIASLAAPVLSPGTSGSITFELVDPLSVPVTGAQVDLQVYAFNAYPGNASQAPPAAGAVELENASGGWASDAALVVAGSEAPGSAEALTVPVRAPHGAPAGTYAIRIQVTVVANGTSYLLRSRGYFPDPLWASATTGPNGTSTLNLTRLGVSGVVPETAVLVPPPSIAPVLYAVLGGSVVLAGVGAYWVWRRGPGSSSGRVAAPGARSAESALGNRRTSDGD